LRICDEGYVRQWLHKSVRTLLVVVPSLSFFVTTGDQRGVMLAFAALCLSVPYGDRSFRPAHLAGCSLVAVLLTPATVWLQHYPKLYVPFIALAGVAYTLVRRSTLLPPRMPTWVLIYVLYQSSELRAEKWSTVSTADLLIVPAMIWVYVTCFYLWPWRGAESVGPSAGASQPAMSVPVNAAYTALSMATAAVLTLVFNLPHPNWAVWSSLTVIRPARAASLRRSGERLAGAVIGCALGLVVVRTLNDAPMMLAVITVVVVVFMVAFEQYTLAVAVRSALAPLAAFALSGDALGAGEARFYCILIGVTIGTALMLILSSQWVSNLSKRLVKKMRRSEAPAA